MQPHRLHPIIPEADLQRRVNELAGEIGRTAAGRDLVLIGILRGSFIFLADLVRALHRRDVHARIDFMVLESYGSGTTSSGTVRVVKDCTLDVSGADVVVVDDILDSGRTLSHAIGALRAKGAASVRACALLDKPSRRQVPCNVAWTGFTVADRFVVGYGLDYDHHYRELPYIAEVLFEPPPA